MNYRHNKFLDSSKVKCLTLWHLASFENSCAKTAGSHVASCVRNLGTESGRELFKGSKDTASLLVCTQKIFFCFGGAGFL